MKYRFGGFLALLLLFCTLVSCNGPMRYRNDVEPKSLINHAVDTLDDGIRYAEDDEEHFDPYFQMPEDVDEVEIRYATDGSHINEVGVLHVKGNADAAAELLEGYLSRTLEERREFYDSYIPNETPKLRDAEVHTYGSYVVYAVLDKPAREAFFKSIREQLKT